MTTQTTTMKRDDAAAGPDAGMNTEVKRPMATPTTTATISQTASSTSKQHQRAEQQRRESATPTSDVAGVVLEVDLPVLGLDGAMISSPRLSLILAPLVCVDGDAALGV